LICQQTVEKFEVVPVRYPVELEQRMREMIFDENKKEIARQFQLVCEEMKREKYFPKEIKYSIIRFCMAAGLNYRNYGGQIDETEILSLMQQITYAISWKQIEKAIQGLERMISYEHKFERYSTLIQKAMEIVSFYTALSDSPRSIGIAERFFVGFYADRVYCDAIFFMI